MKKLGIGLTSICLAGLAAHASASSLSMTSHSGVLRGVNFVNGTVDPSLYFPPGMPQFTLSNITVDYAADDTNGVIVTGIHAQLAFSPFTYAIDASIAGKGTITAPHSVYELGNSGTLIWDGATRTLTLGQPLLYTSATDTTLGGTKSTYADQTSDARLEWSSELGSPPSCTTNGVVCTALQPIIDQPSIERFYLTLTFDAGFTDFSGSAVGIDVGGTTPLGKSGNALMKFDILPTPVPAAAWLFGSALLGLGAARRRS